MGKVSFTRASSRCRREEEPAARGAGKQDDWRPGEAPADVRQGRQGQRTSAGVQHAAGYSSDWHGDTMSASWLCRHPAPQGQTCSPCASFPPGISHARMSHSTSRWEPALVGYWGESSQDVESSARSNSVRSRKQIFQPRAVCGERYNRRESLINVRRQKAAPTPLTASPA